MLYRKYAEANSLETNMEVVMSVGRSDHGKRRPEVKSKVHLYETRQRDATTQMDVFGGTTPPHLTITYNSGSRRLHVPPFFFPLLLLTAKRHHGST